MQLRWGFQTFLYPPSPSTPCFLPLETIQIIRSLAITNERDTCLLYFDNTYWDSQPNVRVQHHLGPGEDYGCEVLGYILNKGIWQVHRGPVTLSYLILNYRNGWGLLDPVVRWELMRTRSDDLEMDCKHAIIWIEGESSDNIISVVTVNISSALSRNECSRWSLWNPTSDEKKWHYYRTIFNLESLRSICCLFCSGVLSPLNLRILSTLNFLIFVFQDCAI